MLHLLCARPCNAPPELRLAHQRVRRLALTLPGVGFRVEDAISEKVEDLAVLVSFRIVGEIGVKHMVDIGWIDGGEDVHAGEPGTLEQPSAAVPVSQLNGPVIEAMDVEESGEHAQERPVSWTSNSALPPMKTKKMKKQARERRISG